MSKRCGLAALLCVAWLSAGVWAGEPAGPAAPGDRPAFGGEESALNLDVPAGGNGRDPAAVAEEEMGKGDMKLFDVKTDSDISGLEVGDIYRSSNGLFKVTSIKSKGNTGGEFVVQRVAGALDPDRKFTFAGTRPKDRKPPQTIVSTQTLLDLYKQGGFFLHPIALLALVMLVLILNCVWILRRRAQIPPDFVAKAQELLRQGKLDEFEDLSLKRKGLFPYLCRAMVDRFDTSTQKDLERRVEIAATGQIARLRTPVKALNLVAVAAPLLGLLGTIVGMVIVFEAVAGSSGASKATALAAGIRVKLFCTAFALMVAIPALFAFFIFNSRLSGIIAESEELSEEFLHDAMLLKRNAGEGEEEEEVDEDEDEEEEEEEDDEEEAAAPQPAPAVVAAPATPRVKKVKKIRREGRP